MDSIFYSLRVIWACAKKDIRIALTERLFTIVSLFVPVTVLILMSLFAISGGKAPTAVVMLDQGPYAQAFYRSMDQAHSFMLTQTSTSEAARQISAGEIVAVVTIPADFDANLQKNQPVSVDVAINNLNTDFTNDIRRAIPLSITSFYASNFPNLVNITTHEIDAYPQDTDYIPYLAVSILVIALMIGGLLQSGPASAKEWESHTIKELLLSPADRWAITVGKMLGSILIGLGSALFALAILIFIVGIQPAHWIELIGYILLCLIIFNSLGVLFGTLIKQRMPVIALSMGTALPLFFISGAFGPISFQAAIIQWLAPLTPVYYLIVLCQHAFHNVYLNTLGIGLNTLILMTFALALVGLETLALNRSILPH
jgi:ABC-2 type transport system permease protein